MNTQAVKVLEALKSRFPGQSKFRRKDIDETASQLEVSFSGYVDLLHDKFRLKRGLYDYSSMTGSPQAQSPEPQPVMKLAAQVSSTINTDTYVPERDSTYVKWGSFDDVLKIVKSNAFYPIYIAGLSGNGKTMMVEQACAFAGREYIRVQISPETDEDDLIGGFRLLNGETVFAKGPVIKAMERGAILLIDEIDRATNKIMCLQGVLEGKPVLIKKTGELIRPSPGFNVLATANTKGKGSDDGRFVAATIIDEAFLERFVATIEQPYPSLATERKIVKQHMTKFGKMDEQFADLLCTWSEVIRKTFEDDGVDEVISTRRLCHIANTYAIFEDRLKAIQMCISRFDADTKAAFLDLYTKIDPSVAPQKPVAETPVAATESVPSF